MTSFADQFIPTGPPKPEATKERYTPDIVEGVMFRIISEIGRACWNAHSIPWGPEWGGEFSDVELEDVSVRIERCEDDGAVDFLLHVQANGSQVSTWLDGKRLFHDPHVPDGWDNHEFIRWAEAVLASIYKYDTKAMKAKGII